MLSKEPVHLQKLNLILVFLDPGHKHTMVRLEEVVSHAISSMSQYSFLFSALKTHNNLHVALQMENLDVLFDTTIRSLSLTWQHIIPF